MYSAATYSDLGYDTIIIMGQSNASGAASWDAPEQSRNGVFMLGLDNKVKPAYEPTHDSGGQVDLVNYNGTGYDKWGTGNSGDWSGQNVHSPWVRAASKTYDHTRRKLMLVPNAKGTTYFRHDSDDSVAWDVPEDPFDRSRLFGTTNHRRLMVGPPKAVWFFGQESSTDPSYIGTYREDFIKYLAAIRREFNSPNLPIVIVQLGSNDNGAVGTPAGWNATDEQWERISLAREYMRQVDADDPNTILVSAYDQGIGTSGVHLDRTGYANVADRVALATRKLVYGESLDAEGPRIASVNLQSSTDIRITFDRDIATTASSFAGWVRVYDDNVAEASVSVGNFGTDTVQCAITVGSITGTAHVTYAQVKSGTLETDIIKGVTDDAIPAPAFSVQIN